MTDEGSEMSVAVQLGLGAGLASPSLAGIEAAWNAWRSDEPALRGPADVSELRPWLRLADPVKTDALLRALVRLGSPSGSDELLAAQLTAWALLPGACVLARRLRSLSPQLDQLVATQLWLEIRQFPWERLGKVAANVLANTRVRVLDECGRGSHAGRGSDCWTRTHVVDPMSAFWTRLPALARVKGEKPVDELDDLFGDAVGRGVLSAEDLQLLQCLLAQAHRLQLSSSCRGRGGLLANNLVEAVATTSGLSPATVRRRVRTSTVAIAQATRSGLIEAA